MAVEARFFVWQVTKRPPSRMGNYAEPIPIGDVTMRAEGHGKPGNEAWASATPAGEFTMTIRTDALAWFEDRLGETVRIRIDDVPG